MTLVDTNVLLDVLVDGARHGDESERRMATGHRSGGLRVNEIIAAELAPAFDVEDELWSALAEASVPRGAVPQVWD